jgi:hypothetical protein
MAIFLFFLFFQTAITKSLPEPEEISGTSSPPVSLAPDAMIQIISHLSFKDAYSLSKSVKWTNDIIIQILRHHDARLDGQDAVKSLLYSNHPKKWIYIDHLLKNPTVDPSVDSSLLFNEASSNGQTDLVARLLKDQRINPATQSNAAIRRASQNGHYDIVKLLMQDPRVNPSDLNNFSLIWAQKGGYEDIVQLLLTDERVDPNAKNTRRFQKTYPFREDFLLNF